MAIGLYDPDRRCKAGEAGPRAARRCYTRPAISKAVGASRLDADGNTHLMTQTRTTSAASVSGAPVPRAALRPRSGEESYIAGLKARLFIAPDQAQPWRAFTDALSANRRRMRSGNTGGECPFGPTAHRLDALASMQRAAQRLIAVLDPVQRRAAVQVLPLCCLQEVPEIRRHLASTLGGSYTAP